MSMRIINPLFFYHCSPHNPAVNDCALFVLTYLCVESVVFICGQNVCVCIYKCIYVVLIYVKSELCICISVQVVFCFD